VLFSYFNCDFFSVRIMYNHVNYISKKKTRLIADDVYEIIIKVLNMVNSLKFEINFLGFSVFYMMM
jgi:hypothetical protein